MPTRTIQDIVYGKDGKPGRVPGLAHSKNIVAFPGGLPIKTKNGILLALLELVELQEMKMNNVLMLLY